VLQLCKGACEGRLSKKVMRFDNPTCNLLELHLKVAFVLQVKI